MNPITCGMAADLLPLYLDGCCSADSGAAIEAHMDACPACRAQYAQLRRDLTYYYNSGRVLCFIYLYL